MFNYGDASNYLDQGTQYLKPWYDTGQDALHNYYQTVLGLTQHPGQLTDQIYGQYQASPYSQYQLQQTQAQMNATAAAGGYLGTPNEQVAMGQQAQGIVSRDQQQYYQNVMQPYTMGLQGLGTIAGMGEKAAMGDVGISQAQARLSAMKSSQLQSLIGGVIGGGASVGAHFIPGYH